MIGRPKTRYEAFGKCEVCGAPVRWLTSDSKPIVKRACSVKCRMVLIRAPRLKCPDDKTLLLLYVRYKLSTVQIAAMYDTDPTTVYKAVRRAGAIMRKYTSVSRCQIDGCLNRPQKIRHTNNGSEYGTLCKKHREQHRKGLATDYWKREGQVITLNRAFVRGARSSKLLKDADLGDVFNIEVAE